MFRHIPADPFHAICTRPVLREVCGLYSGAVPIIESRVLIAWLPARLPIFHSVRTGTTQPRLSED